MTKCNVCNAWFDQSPKPSFHDACYERCGRCETRVCVFHSHANHANPDDLNAYCCTCFVKLGYKHITHTHEDSKSLQQLGAEQ